MKGVYFALRLPVTFLIAALASVGIAADWSASQLIPLQKFLTKKMAEWDE